MLIVINIFIPALLKTAKRVLLFYLQKIATGSVQVFSYCPPNTVQCCSGEMSSEIHLIFHASLHPVILSFETTLASEP